MSDDENKLAEAPSSADAKRQDDDAPTSVEENEGFSTVLSDEPLVGVQKDESEKEG